MADNTSSSIYPTPRVYRDIRNPDGTLNITNALQMSYHVFLQVPNVQKWTTGFHPESVWPGRQVKALI
jgi:hypothetical protein